MTPQEQEMIDGLVERIRNTQVNDKDLAAEQHLQQGLAGYPDAVYVLAQTVLVQQYGLQQAQQQIQALQSQLDQLRQQQATVPANGGSFLSHLFGSAPQQPPPQQNYGPGYSASQVPYQPVNNPSYPPPAYPPPSYAASYPVYTQPMGYGAPSSGGFLRGAMQTAAGVAAGEMMFEGMESLFHGFGGGYGGGRPGETVVNNYYGEGNEHGAMTHDDDSFYNPANDASRQDSTDTGAAHFADNSPSDDYVPAANDMPADDAGYDASNSGDSNFDSGGDDSSF
jgi:hypothetical protein